MICHKVELKNEGEKVMYSYFLVGTSPSHHYADWNGIGERRWWSANIGEWYENHSKETIVLDSPYRAWWGVTDNVVCPPNHKIRLVSQGEDSDTFEVAKI